MTYESFIPYDTVKRSRVSEEKGFTLVEILIAMALFGIVSAMVVTVFDSFQKGYTSQQVTSDVLQKARSALSYMASEIKTAGLDPSDTKKFKVVSASLTQFTYDFDTPDSDGVFDGDLNTDGTKASERKTFRFAGNKLQVVENLSVYNAPSVGTEKDPEDLLSNINMDAESTDSASRFEYLDKDGVVINKNSTELVPTDDLQRICAVRIFLSVREKAGRSGNISKALDTTVLCRNLQFNAY